MTNVVNLSLKKLDHLPLQQQCHLEDGSYRLISFTLCKVDYDK